MSDWKIAIPVFAVGIYVGILLGHSVVGPQPMTYTYLPGESVSPAGAEGEGVRTDLHPRTLDSDARRRKEVKTEFHPGAIAYKPLGPEFTDAPWWEEFDTNRTLYVAPYTGIANTLQAMGSAFTIAYREKINVHFVFHRPWFGPATWDDLFSFPIINFTRSFPDGEMNIGETKSCTYKNPFTWKTTQVEWTANPNGTGEIGCLMTCCWREPPFPESILWFYRILRPATVIQGHINRFKAEQNWDRYQWVGVHFRRTDNVKTMKNLMKFHRIDELRRSINKTTAESMLPVQNYVDLMNELSQQWPIHDLGPYQVVKPIRFFLATDRDEMKPLIVRQFSPGKVVSYEKGMDSDRLRQEVWGVQLGIIDMFLLASCRVVIGTPFSTFSEAASYIGGSLLLEPDFEYSA